MTSINKIKSRLGPTPGAIKTGAPRPKIVNHYFTCGTNGVIAIVNNEPVIVHERFGELEVHSGPIAAHEREVELEKLEAAKRRFGEMISDNDLSIIAPAWLNTAKEIVSNLADNAAGAFSLISGQHIEQDRQAITEAWEKIDEKNTNLSEICHTLEQSARGHLRLGEKERLRLITERDRLDDEIFSDRYSYVNRETGLKDMELIRDRVLAFLIHQHKKIPNEKGAHVAEVLTWEEMKRVTNAKAFIFMADKIGASSHQVVFAQQDGIPVAWLPDLFQVIKPGDHVSIDMRRGLLVVNPNEATIANFKNRKAGYVVLNDLLRTSWEGSHKTLDGYDLPALQENIKDINDVFKLKDGARVGLFRTEGEYGKRRPEKRHLVRIFRQLIRKADEVNIRLLDIASDKLPEFFKAADKELFRGSQGGIDYLIKEHKANKERSFLYEQLKALLIACAREKKNIKAGKKIRILIPMVTNVGQIDYVTELMRQIETDIAPSLEGGTGVVKGIEIGIMIETKEAVRNLGQLATRCTYFSIGTNDLTQSILGFSERKKIMTAPEYDWLSPNVIKAIKRIIEVAKEHNIMVGSCGEMAHDPFGAILKRLMGIDALSMNESYHREINHILSNIHLGEWASYTDAVEPLGLTVVDKVIQLKTKDKHPATAWDVRKFLYRLIMERSRHADTRVNLENLITDTPITYLAAAA